MEYVYLNQWLHGQELAGKRPLLGEILRFEDQYLLTFPKAKEDLQISLFSGNPFCFTVKKTKLPFVPANEISPIIHRLQHTRLGDVSISEHDRIIRFHFFRTALDGKQEELILVAELIPRFTNLILVQDGIIFDSLRRFSFAENQHRQILPGVEYLPPPAGFQQHDATTDIPQLNARNYDSINDYLHDFYYVKQLGDKADHIRNDIVKSIKRDMKKKVKKLEKQLQERSQAEKETDWLQAAELLKAHYHLLKKGQDSVTVVDYYKPGQDEVDITLLPELTPQKNIERYLKKYRKAKNGAKMIEEQIANTEAEIDELHRWLFDLEDESDYLALKEFSKAGIAKKGETARKAPYRRLMIDDGWEIFIGRTSTENDQLTTRFAKPWDWWFHSRIFKGSHVVLRNYKKKEPSPEHTMLAARLAAYYSKAKKSSNVPVDMTQIRYIRKPRGSAPGFVTYTNQKTLYVDPLSMRDAAACIDSPENDS